MSSRQTEIANHLENFLKQHSPSGSKFFDVLEYAAIPAGKQFRARLVYALATDLGAISDDHKTLASSIELHHTYTLLHDDLPCMDDDDMRRGRLSTHMKFGEWSAVLAGDALLNMSLAGLSQITAGKLPWLLKFYGHCTGARGLILGQYMDMSGMINSDLNSLLQTHTLKTSRLIQLAIVGSYHLARPMEFYQLYQLMKLGKFVGINFQLLDDYEETEGEIGQHERDVNPFLKYDKAALVQMIQRFGKQSLDLCESLSLFGLREMIEHYYQKFDIIAC